MQPPPIRAALRLRDKVPIDQRVRIERARSRPNDVSRRRRREERIRDLVKSARLDDGDLSVRVCGEAIREREACRAAADNHVVELCILTLFAVLDGHCGREETERVESYKVGGELHVDGDDDEQPLRLDRLLNILIEFI